MTHERMIELLRAEWKCVLYAAGLWKDNPDDPNESPARCDRDCEFCVLVQEDEEVLEAYRMAIELLTAQNARILTRDEIIGWDGYIWKEYRDMKAMTAILINHQMERVPYHGDYPTKGLDWDWYGSQWRCWSAQPTDEQRKAAEWDG